MPDPDGRLTRLYRVRTPVVNVAQRYTFVIGAGRKILRVDSGRDAVKAENAIVSCQMPQRPRA